MSKPLHNKFTNIYNKFQLDSSNIMIKFSSLRGEGTIYSEAP